MYTDINQFISIISNSNLIIGQLFFFHFHSSLSHSIIGYLTFFFPPLFSSTKIWIFLFLEFECMFKFSQLCVLCCRSCYFILGWLHMRSICIYFLFYRKVIILVKLGIKGINPKIKLQTKNCTAFSLPK